MALLDISLVTAELIEFIDQAFDPLPAQAVIPKPTIYSAPPAHLGETGLGMYLYHLAEDPHYKNLAPPGRDEVPIRFTPMGLNLYYHLSANDTDADEEVRALNEQKMMSIAVKALRDNPVINFTANNSENRLRIVLNPVPPNEVVTFWTAGSSEVKLSAYYEVSVALLEPQESRRPSTRVLSYGVHTFVQGAPRIMSSENTITYNPPGTTSSRQLRASPAQVPFDNRFSLSGSGFNGSNLELLMINPALGITFLTDASWQINIVKNTLSATAGRMAIELDDEGNPLGAIPLFPGIYAAQIRVTRQRMMPNGQMRSFTHLSNHCPISISPSVATVTELAPNSSIFVVTGFNFRVAAVNIRVYVADIQLTAGDYNGLLAGEFDINPVLPVNPEDDSDLRFHLPGGLDSGDYLPIRIFINGIESESAWIQVP